MKAKPSTHSSPKAAVEIEELLDELRKQHESILTEVQELLEDIHGRRKIDDFENRLGELVNSARKHQLKEEEELVPILRGYLYPEFISSVTTDHNQLERVLQEIDQFGRKHAEKLEIPLSNFGELARAHFSREENVLFWYASLRLNATALGQPKEA